MKVPNVEKKSDERRLLCAALLFIGAFWFATATPSEPFFNNDETRHILTGVYFRDLFQDRPFHDLAGYTVRYYLQYPALGLLIWPPFFYALEGVAMSVCGTSVVVGRVLVSLFALLACGYVFRFVRLRYDAARALGATLCFGVAPVTFQLSHYVMLEMPTLALALVSTFHFWRYLTSGLSDVPVLDAAAHLKAESKTQKSPARRDLFVASVAASLAALTRFDAIYLLPLFVAYLGLTRRWEVLWRREVWAALVLALVLVTPFYAVTAKYVGWLHLRQAAEQFSVNSPPLLSAWRWAFYPRYLQVYLGWPLLLPALLGFWGSLRSVRARPFLVLAAVVYLTFTLIREIDERHAVYWLPVWAFFAAQGVWTLAGWWQQPKLYPPLLAIALVLTMWVDVSWRGPKTRGYVRGYEEAAQYVAANPPNTPF